MFKYEKITLKNGVRIVLAPMKETNTVTFIVGTSVGSRFETEKEAGISHFLEHMMFKGTAERPNTLAIAEELDAIGGEYNAFTGKDATVYYAKVNSKKWQIAVDVISDMFLHSKLEQTEIDREKGTIIEELNMYEDDPRRTVGDLFENLLYGQNPLGREIIGYKKTVKAFKRADFVDYYRKHYIGANIVIGVAGKFEREKVREMIEENFAGMPRGKKDNFAKVTENQKAAALKIKYKKTDQTHLMLGVRAFHQDHPDRFVLGLLSAILGGSMSSRLFISVRERQGLAYYIRSAGDAFADCGYYAVHAGVNNEKVGQAVGSIIAELVKIKKEGVSERELRKAKDFATSKAIMGMETSDEVAEFFLGQELNKEKIMTLEEILQKIEAVGINDIQRVAREIFVAKNLNLAVIGPHKSSQSLQKILKL